MKRQMDELITALLKRPPGPAPAEPPPGWQTRLMADIRTQSSTPSWPAQLERLVWPLAPTLAAVALLLFLLSTRLSITPTTGEWITLITNPDAPLQGTPPSQGEI